MRLLISTAIALTAALVAAGPTAGVAAAPSNRPRDIKVSVLFLDGTNKIQSDGGGVYQDGIGGVVAYIRASDSGQLIFSTNAFNTPGRTLQFFFDTCLLESCANQWATWTYLNERSGILANALRADRTVLIGGLTAMTVDQDLPLWAKFDIPLDSDPAFWNVCFDSRKVVGPCGAAPGGTSTDAHVRRDARDKWTISANSTTDQGDLVRDSQTRKSRTFSLAGTYRMPFSFTVECVNAADCP